MRYAALIAAREFLENAKTKGFWIGILMLPVMVVVAIAATAMLSGNVPTRHYVLIDRSGDLGRAFEADVERLHQGAVLDALAAYAREHVRPDARRELARTPFVDALGGPGRPDPRAVDAFVAAGGADAMLARLAPLLADDAPPFAPPPRRLRSVAPPPEIDTGADLGVIAEQLRPYLTGERRLDVDGRRESLFAAILIGPDVLDHVSRAGGEPVPFGGPAGRAAGVQYWSSNVSDDGLRELLARSLNEEIRSREYVARGVGLDVVREVEETRLAVGSFDPSKAPGEEAVSVIDRAVGFAPVAFVYLLWISLFIVLQMLLSNTVEEKSNRIIEVLLSSVTPRELMMGKLAGIALIGFAMVGTWLLTVLVAVRLYSGPGAELFVQVLEAVAGTKIMLTFAVYFVLGYVLYAGLFLAVGSLCNTLKEAQSMQGPITMLLVVPLVTMSFIVRDPNGAIATAMTWIPLYTPFAMLNRAAGNPPLLDVIGSLALMIAMAALVLWLSARVFRIGILRTGQRPKLAEVARWILGTAEG